MTCIVPAVVPDYPVGFGSKKVHYLAFAFVAPVCADNYGVHNPNPSFGNPDASVLPEISFISFIRSCLW